jgi:MerR family transcriptional regulator/heat shock protein HspR
MATRDADRGRKRRGTSRRRRDGRRAGKASEEREERALEEALEIEAERGVFMISVAAELAEMHPQTLRMYEARGLITPERSPRNTRLYSRADVERLRRIQHLTSEQGLNLAGVDTVMRLEERLDRTRAELTRLRDQAVAMERQLAEEVERVRKSFRAEIVPYGAYEPPEIIPAEHARSVRIKVERPAKGSAGDSDAG